MKIHKFQILFIVVIICCAKSFSQELDGKYIDWQRDKDRYEWYDTILNTNNIHKIRWDVNNISYRDAGDNEPYMFILNQEQYNIVRTSYSQNIDFDNYILFVGLFRVTSIGWLQVIFDNEDNITMLSFQMDVRANERISIGQSIKKRGLKSVSYLIPKKYFNDTKRLLYVVWH